MRLPLLSQPRDRRGGSIQTNKRAALPGVRDRDVTVVGHNSTSGIGTGGEKSTTTTVTVSGEQDGEGVSESEGGQDQLETGAIVSSKCTSTNSSIHEVYFLLGDEDSVADVAERVKATCSAIVSPPIALNYNYTSGSEIEISSESWEIVQWYRGSTFGLALEEYNSTSVTDTPTPALDSPFFTCLNNTISTNLPLLPNPMILKSHSGWHPNPQSSKGGEIGVIIVICLVFVALSPLIVPGALFLLALVLLGIVTVVCWCLETCFTCCGLVVTVVCWCLEMCCTCCGLVSCVDSDGTATVETQPQALVTTPPKRMSAMAMDPEKGRYKGSSYAGNSPRFPPDAVIARTVQDWDTPSTHWHYTASQIPKSYNYDNIIRPSLSSLETSTTTTVCGAESEGDKNPIADSAASDSNSVADSINEAPPSL